MLQYEYMPHIHTQDGQHDATVSLFIIRYHDDEPLAMLIMHKKLGSLMMPGGHIELDETPWASAAHEAEEEAGYALEELSVLQPTLRLKMWSEAKVHPQPFLSQTHRVVGEHFHSDLGYVLIANDTPSSPPGEGESTDIRWLSAAEIENLPEELIMPNIREIYQYIFGELLVGEQWETVPATKYIT